MVASTTSERSVYRLAEMTWPEVEAAVDHSQTMLVPVGSTEQHGHHLPLGVDVYMPKQISERVARRTGCFLAPPVWYGVSPHHTYKPGTFTVESETFQRYVRDICVSSAEWGVENVLLVNGHYLVQDPELDIIVRELRNEYDLQAFHVSLDSVFEEAAERVRSSAINFHASEFETSCMLELRPDLVQMDRATATVPPSEGWPLTSYDAYGENKVGWALNRTDMGRLTESGNLGDPTVATAEKGAELITEAVENIVELVDALSESA